MKHRLLFPIVAVSGLLAMQTVSFAQEDGSGIQGSEEFEAKIILVGTTNAPGASGCAEIEAENDNGTNTSQMEIKTEGLTPGQYQVNVVKTSDGSTEAVAQITVGTEDDGEDLWLGSSNQCSVTWTNGTLTWNVSSTNSISCTNNQGQTESESEFTLPSDVDPTDIAEVQVADLLGNIVLVGDVGSSVSNSMNFNATVQITAGPAAPNAQGIAQIQNHLNKGKHKGKFLLNAVNVPAGATLNVLVNGSVVGTVKSSKNGHVKLTRLPVDLLTVQSIELQDSGGATVGVANF